MNPTTEQQLREPILDELMDLYLGWREASVEVEAAYDRWTAAATEERGLAHAAYSAALDREDQAAACYEQLAGRVEELWADVTPAAA